MRSSVTGVAFGREVDSCDNLLYAGSLMQERYMKGAKSLNSILVDSSEVEYYTYLGPIFEAIQNKQNDYNWLITELNTNWIPDNFLNYFDQYTIYEGYWDPENRYLISGTQLTKLIKDHKIQFIWGVLSGFNKSEKIDINSLDVVPFADGNTAFWEVGVSVQHPKAEIEIICWDSTLTLLISKDQSIVKNFKEYFKEARDLDEYNIKE